MQDYYQRLINYLTNLPDGITIIPKQGGTFNLEVVRVGNQISGVKVSNLRSKPFLPIEVFRVAIESMYNSQNRTVSLGNAKGDGPLGNGLEINSIEGLVARKVYNIPIGKHAFMRITPIRRILEAALVCVSHQPKKLTLVD
jgi:hypothetical protein